MGKRGVPEVRYAEGVAPFLRSLLGREIRVGVRRGPRPELTGTAAMRAVIRRGARRRGNRYRVVRARSRGFLRGHVDL